MLSIGYGTSKCSGYSHVAAHPLITVGPDTINAWIYNFERHDGHFTSDSRGDHQRYWLLNEEDLKERALSYVRVHQYPKKGFPAMRAIDFTNFMNGGCDCDVCGGMKSPLEGVDKEVLKQGNISLPISEETGRKWLKRLGGQYKNHCKGIYFDGHDQDYVKRYAGRIPGVNGFLQREQIRAYSSPLWITMSREEATAMDIEDAILDGKKIVTLSWMLS